MNTDYDLASSGASLGIECATGNNVHNTRADRQQEQLTKKARQAQCKVAVVSVTLTHTCFE